MTTAISGSATPEEAAAIAAAVERFLHDHTPPAVVPAHGLDSWTRAAMLEGVAREVPLDTLLSAHSWINT